MRIFLLVVHLLLTLVMISVILIQRGEDANAGSSSGYGAMPGVRGSKNLLTRLTSVLAGIFFANCLCMAILVRRESQLNVVADIKTEVQSTTQKTDQKSEKADSGKEDHQKIDQKADLNSDQGITKTKNSKPSVNDHSSALGSKPGENK